jgi:LemA protein
MRLVTTFWIVLGIVVVVVLFLVATYNRLVRLRNRVANSWSQIDVQLRRRYDLIPNLVNTVKGYAAHEKEIFERVAEARNAAISAKSVPEQAQAENQITQALRQLFAVVEAYPDLKANQNFLALQEELTATEGRIAYARQFYNDSALTYNNATQTFPSNIIAGMFNFTPREFFEIEEGAAGPVQVQF